MFKYLEQQRANYLLLGLADTANQIGLTKLEPAETAILQLLYEERSTTNEFFERAETFHARLKQRHGLSREFRSVDNFNTAYHSAQTTTRPTTAQNRQEVQITTRDNGNYNQWVVRSGKLPVSGGGGLQNRKSTNEAKEQISNLHPSSRKSQNRTFFLTGNIKTLHESRPKSAKWDLFAVAKKEMSGYIATKQTASTYFTNLGRWTREASPMTSQPRSFHQSPGTSVHNPIKPRNSRKSLKKKSTLSKPQRTKRKRNEQGKQNSPSQPPKLLKPDPENIALAESLNADSKIKMKWRQAIAEAIHRSKQKIIDVAFWVRPATNKYDYENKVREQHDNLEYDRRQRQSSRQPVPSTLSKVLRQLAEDSVSTVTNEQHSDSLIQISI